MVKKKGSKKAVEDTRGGEESVEVYAIIDSLKNGVEVLEKEFRRNQESLRDKQEVLQVQSEELEVQNEELRESSEALRKAEEYSSHLASIVESSDNAIIGKRLNGVITSWNAGAERMFGYSANEIIGKNISILTTPGHHDEISGILDRIKKGERVEHFETVRKRKDGKIIDVSVTVSPIRDKSGKIVGASSIKSDITQRKIAEAALHEKQEELEVQAEELEANAEELRVNNEELIRVTCSLRDSEERYRDLADNIPNLAWTADAEGWIFWYNKQWYDYTGTTLEEMQGWGWQKVHHPDYVKVVTREWSSSIKSGKPYDSIFPLRGRDGNYRWFLTRVTPIKDSDGKIQRWFGTNTDITERRNAEEALRESEAKYKNLFNNIEEMVTVYDVERDEGGSIVERRLLEANPAFLRASGVSSIDEIRGKTSSEVFGKAWSEEQLSAVQKAMETGRVQVQEVTRPESGRHYITSVVPLDANTYLGTSWDITNLKRAEEALRESEARRKVAEAIDVERQRLYDVLETMPAMICLITQDYHIAFANRSFRDTFGESHGRHCYEYCFGKSRPCEFCESMTPLKTGKPHHWEVNAPDGKVIEAHDYPFTDADGSSMVLEMDIDITERKKAESTLRDLNETLKLHIAELRVAEKTISAERQRFYDVLETLPAYLVLLTPDYHVPFANRFFRERFGESHGRRCFEYLFGRAEPCENCETYKVLKTGAPHHWEWTGPDGRNYDIYDYPFKDTDGSPLIMEMGIDITERKKAETALNDLNKTLEQRVAERTEELGEAKQRAELYLDLMGHDISNMHQIAMNQLQLAQEIMAEDGKLEGEEKEFVDTSLQTLERSAKLIDNVRKLQRMETGQYKSEPMDIGEMLTDVVAMYSDSGRNMSIEYVPVHSYYVEANPLLKDIFVNLVDNAMKHSNVSPNIGINVDGVREDGRAFYRVAVEDHGPGVPDEKKDEIFHRLKRGQTMARGTGLGLYIVKTLVESFHGRVTVEDRVPGDYTKGSRFLVYLPVAEDKNAE